MPVEERVETSEFAQQFRRRFPPNADPANVIDRVAAEREDVADHAPAEYPISRSPALRA